MVAKKVDDRHDETGRTKSALQAMMLAERFLDSSEFIDASLAFDGFDFAPVACTASVRQERALLPSRMTVQAPQTPCSHPTWVPVRQRSWRRKSLSSVRASIVRVIYAPLTLTVIVFSLISLEAFRGSRGSRRREAFGKDA